MRPLLALLLSSCAWISDAEWEERLGRIACDTGGCDTGPPDSAGDGDLDGDGALPPFDCWDDPDTTPAEFVALNGLDQPGAADVHPGATDAPYDGVDADCGGDGDFDADGDGYDSATWSQRDGSVGEDCYDAEADGVPLDETCGDGNGSLDPDEVYPGAADEVYDGVDADCAADSDYDADGDGWPACEECDDTDAARYPDETVAEVWYDGQDDNCDGNDGDQDGDGFYVAGYAFEVPDTFAAGDCWDDPGVIPDGYHALNGLEQPEAADVWPGAVDAAYDGVPADCEDDDAEFDQDGDGQATDTWPDGDGLVGEDCDDEDADIYVGAIETYGDGTDQDCDGSDSYDQDGDGYTTDDCDDTRAAVSPGAAEDCATAYDDDCDGDTDALNATGCSNWYYDGDGDGFGDPSASQCWCLAQAATGYDQAHDDDCDDADPDTFPGAAALDSATACMNDDDGDDYGDETVSSGVTAGTDCDDASSSDYPGATETVNNGDDEDCDDVESCYTDADNDDYGTTTVRDSTDLDCNNSLMAAVSTDCDDSDADTFPGAASLESTTACMNDDDGDDYGDTTASSGVTAGTDCDDADSNDYPGATETCNDDDDDCDGTADDGLTAYYSDADGDGYGSGSADCSNSTGVTNNTDCDDASSSDHPGATETVNNGDDEDCDGVDACYTDADDDNYGTSVVRDSTDLDCNNALMATVSTDCDDGDADTFPGAASNDSTTSCMNDDDGDNYGDASVSAGVTAGTDCDDSSSSDYPGASETVNNGDDEDCDGVDACYTDADDDNYGTSVVRDSTDLDCNNSNMATVSTDCNDTDADTFPGAASNDSATACMNDDDGDNYGDESVSAGVTAGTDCDDTSSSIRPSATEVVNDGVDQDCDDVDACYTDADNDNYGTTVVIDSADLDCADASEATVSTDCDDSDPDTFPGAAANDSSTACMNDDDGDNYGDSTASALYVEGTDCNDASTSVSPEDLEVVGDGIDQDCDGMIE